MAIMNVNPTRMQLTKLKKQLTTAVRGHKMLKDKRDELMRQFLDLVRETRTLRDSVEQKLTDCNAHFVNASAVMSKESLDASLMSPKQQVTLETSSKKPSYILFEKTRRRVNSLEHVMIPRYQDTIKYISMKLEENDRSSRTRLMKVKDMLLDKAHGYSQHDVASNSRL